MIIQQINIADYKNIFLMAIISNYRLIIINGPSDFLVLEQKVMFDRSWKLNLLSAHSEFLI